MKLFVQDQYYAVETIEIVIKYDVLEVFLLLQRKFILTTRKVMNPIHDYSAKSSRQIQLIVATTP